jgi:hypothetical protein
MSMWQIHMVVMTWSFADVVEYTFIKVYFDMLLEYVKEYFKWHDEI